VTYPYYFKAEPKSETCFSCVFLLASFSMTPPHIEELNMGTSFVRSPELSPKLSHRTSDSIDLAPDASSSNRFLNDTDLKAEIDTGVVSEQYFSFKKLWTYAGPGKVNDLRCP
jgi:hypothetical protein